MENKIPEIIKKEFNAETLETIRITTGYSHYMYLVKISKEPFEVIIRFSNNIRKDVNLGKEKYIMEILRKNKIPAPEIYSFNNEYLIMEKFQGQRLDSIWDGLSKEEKIQVTKEIGKLAKRIHEIKFDKFGAIEENGFIRADEAFNFKQVGELQQYNKFVRELLKQGFEDFARLSSYEYISKELLAKVFSYLMANLDKIKYTGKPTLIHGDFVPDHIFVRKNNLNEYEIEGLIDLEFSQASSPEYDLLKLHRKGFFQDEELRQALIQSYGEINEEAIEIFRIIRDFGFAWAMLECGNKELCDKTLTELEKKINEKI